MTDVSTQTGAEPARRPSLKVFAVLFAGILVCLMALYLLFLRYDFDLLYADLAIDDAAWISEELHNQEIRHQIRDGGTSIAVPASNIEDVRLAIYRADGPGKDLRGFELFNESEMGLTDFAQKIKFQRAIQGELARTIMMVEGIRTARVHIALPERSVFRSDRATPTAAVTLQAEERFELSPETVRGVQRLVAASVPLLELDDVTVLNGSGFVISAENDAVDTDGQFEDLRDGGVSASAHDAGPSLSDIARQPDDLQLGELKTVDQPFEPVGLEEAENVETVSVISLPAPPTVSVEMAKGEAQFPVTWFGEGHQRVLWVTLVLIVSALLTIAILVRVLRTSMTTKDRNAFADALQRALQDQRADERHAT